MAQYPSEPRQFHDALWIAAKMGFPNAHADLRVNCMLYSFFLRYQRARAAGHVRPRLDGKGTARV
jgi:hypothetical protein